MAVSLHPQFFVIPSLLIIISLTDMSDAYKRCLDDQKTLLLQLKNNFTYDSVVSRKLVQWDGSADCCQWEGVECDASGHVISLQLDHEGISGGIKNSSSLVSLRYLEKLNLAHNSLNGSIPDSLFTLQSLELLSLSNNLFNGSLQLKNIQSLHNLTALDLSHNELSVDVTGFDSNFSRISQLKKLSLASCNLQKFPDFIRESNMNLLDLSVNQITGEVPSWIWEIGNGELYHLNLSYNLLVDLRKPYHIPSFLSELDMNSNQLRGELPLLSRGASYVDYSNNMFDGPIPLEFVSSNFFLIFLSIANNSISGSIPTSICSAATIQVLDFSSNNLSGSIPPCLVENIPNLQGLNLKQNKISGDIPDNFPTDCGLRYFDLSNNNLGGKFPKSLGNCKSLEVMSVRHNEIEDSFPCMLSSKLQVLVLGFNKLVGEVKCGESWPNLHIMDASYNNLSGDLHGVSFSSWKKMVTEDWDEIMPRRTSFDLNVVRPDFYYRTEVTVTWKGNVDVWSRVLRLAKIIDLSGNNFTGEIPDGIGDLISLLSLNLSHNALTGVIPKSFGDMRILHSLDLSVNQLTGVIPEELTRLDRLGFFNVAYNKLVGKISSSTQLQSFGESSYLGNNGLCGPPLIKRCNLSTDGNEPSRGEAETKSDALPFVLAIALVFTSHNNASLFSAKHPDFSFLSQKQVIEGEYFLRHLIYLKKKTNDSTNIPFYADYPKAHCT